MQLTEKNHNRDSGADLIKQEKETVNLKTSHLKLSSQKCKKRKKKEWKSEESLKDLWDIKFYEFQKEKKERQGQKAYFKKLVENLSKLGKELDIQIQEYPWTLKTEHPETNIIKLLKFKDRERLLKIAREEWFSIYKCMHAQSLQSCLTLCDCMDCSLPGSSVHGILTNTGVSCHAFLQRIFPTQLSRELQD